jgi:hypothetical protein
MTVLQRSLQKEGSSSACGPGTFYSGRPEDHSGSLTVKKSRELILSGGP